MSDTLTAFPRWGIYGHDWAIDFLTKSLRFGRTRHAYLISGAKNVGKSTLAHAFARALNCTHEDVEARPCGACRSCRWVSSGNHPDLLYPPPDERSNALKIDAIRDVMKLIALKPYSSRYRVALFDNFHEAQPRAQDALLKTLEEPPPHAVIILIVPSMENVLATIKSRCQMLPLKPAPTATVEALLKAHGADEARATLIARLSGGRVGWALEAHANDVVLTEREEALNLLEEALRGNRAKRFSIAETLSDVGKDRDALRYFLEMWQTYWRDLLLLKQESLVKPCNTDRRIALEQLAQRVAITDALKALNATRTLLYATLKTNANVRMALEAMLLDYPMP